MNSRLSTRKNIARLGIAAAAMLASAAPAAAQLGPDPVTEVGPGGGPAPYVVPSATCAVRGRFVDTYWFGYTNSSSSSITVPVGANNSIPRTVLRRTFIDAAQPDQFKPGTITNSVAVQVGKNVSATWTITGPSTDPMLSAAASATASTLTPACAPGTSVFSANLRAGNASISFVPQTQVRDGAGLLTQASVTFQAPGFQTVCSLGGIPTPPKLLWGWNDEFGVPASTRVAYYAPLLASEIVRTDTFNAVDRAGNPFTVDFQRTSTSTRTIADPQAVTTQSVGTLSLQQFGWSMVVPTVDATGTCLFGKQKLVSPSVFIGGSEGGFSYSITDPATQSTRTPVFCTFGSTTCEVIAEIVGPGGARMQR